MRVSEWDLVRPAEMMLRSARGTPTYGGFDTPLPEGVGERVDTYPWGAHIRA